MNESNNNSLESKLGIDQQGFQTGFPTPASNTGNLSQNINFENNNFSENNQNANLDNFSTYQNKENVAQTPFGENSPSQEIPFENNVNSFNQNNYISQTEQPPFVTAGDSSNFSTQLNSSNNNNDDFNYGSSNKELNANNNPSSVISSAPITATPVNNVVPPVTQSVVNNQPYNNYQSNNISNNQNNLNNNYSYNNDFQPYQPENENPRKKKGIFDFIDKRTLLIMTGITIAVLAIVPALGAFFGSAKNEEALTGTTTSIKASSSSSNANDSNKGKADSSSSKQESSAVSTSEDNNENQAASSSSTENTDANTAVLAQGQSLWKFATDHGLTPEQVIALNPGLTVNNYPQYQGTALNIK
jgi:hypothetical protein